MSTLSRKLKFLRLYLDGTQFQCQLQSWNIENNSEDGERYYTFCGPNSEGEFVEEDGEFREEAEDNYALTATFFADWRSAGISDFLWEHDQQTVAFQVDHHPDIPGEHVRWSGELKLKAPNVGGESRATEMTEITMQIKGKPLYERV